MNQFLVRLENEQATVDMGSKLASAMTSGAVLFLHGDLGAGKTTLSRGLIQGLGHSGNVKSPTYTLVEPYELAPLSAYHFDLYRLADPEELEFMGFRDYFNEQAVCIIEWPEKGQDFLPSADLELYLTYADEQREIDIRALSLKGQDIIKKIKELYN
jgi:tRNA threonylcarbamoyladenosine biosynthesis protein TsaE